MDIIKNKCQDCKYKINYGTGCLKIEQIETKNDIDIVKRAFHYGQWCEYYEKDKRIK